MLCFQNSIFIQTLLLWGGGGGGGVKLQYNRKSIRVIDPHWLE